MDFRIFVALRGVKMCGMRGVGRKLAHAMTELHLSLLVLLALAALSFRLTVDVATAAASTAMATLTTACTISAPRDGPMVAKSH